MRQIAALSHRHIARGASIGPAHCSALQKPSGKKIAKKVGRDSWESNSGLPTCARWVLATTMEELSGPMYREKLEELTKV